MSQPPHPAPEPRLAAEHIYLLAAAITGTASLAAWLYDVGDPLHQGIFAALRVIACIAGCGYLIRSAETRVKRRIDHLLASREEEERLAGAWIDGVSARPGEPAHLRSVN